MNGDTSPSPLRVLVVDDSLDTTDSLALLLKLWGHQVRVAHDGSAALEAACTDPPDVVFLDVALGAALDGYEVGRRLRALPDLGGALLICMTGYGMESDRRHSREAGFDHHLTKPASPEVLRQLLAAWKAILADRVHPCPP